VRQKKFTLMAADAMDSVVLDAFADTGVSPALVQDQLRRLRKKNPSADMAGCFAAVRNVSLSESNLPLLNEPIPVHEVNPSTDILRMKHRQLDLHGFTGPGADVAFRRTLLNLDRSKAYTIKVNVGQGIHSGGDTVLDKVVERVCRELGLDPPESHPRNPGYVIITILPRPSGDEEEN
jgi:hypothetical protein